MSGGRGRKLQKGLATKNPLTKDCSNKPNQYLGRRVRRPRDGVLQVKEEPIEWENPIIHSRNLYPTHPSPVSPEEFKPIDPSGYSEANYTDQFDTLFGFESKPCNEILDVKSGKRKASMDDEFNMWPAYASPGIPYQVDHNEIHYSEGKPSVDTLSLRNTSQPPENFLEYIAREMRVEKNTFASIGEFPSPHEFEDFVSYLSRVCGIDELKLRSTLSEPVTFYNESNSLQHS